MTSGFSDAQKNKLKGIGHDKDNPVIKKSPATGQLSYHELVKRVDQIQRTPEAVDIQQIPLEQELIQQTVESFMKKYKEGRPQGKSPQWLGANFTDTTCTCACYAEPERGNRSQFWVIPCPQQLGFKQIESELNILFYLDKQDFTPQMPKFGRLVCVEQRFYALIQEIDKPWELNWDRSLQVHMHMYHYLRKLIPSRLRREFVENGYFLWKVFMTQELQWLAPAHTLKQQVTAIVTALLPLTEKPISEEVKAHQLAQTFRNIDGLKPAQQKLARRFLSFSQFEKYCTDRYQILKEELEEL